MTAILVQCTCTPLFGSKSHMLLQRILDATLANYLTLVRDEVKLVSYLAEQRVRRNDALSQMVLKNECVLKGATALQTVH